MATIASLVEAPSSIQIIPEKQTTFESVSLVIPLFNEELGVAALSRRLRPVMERMSRRWRIQLILVDDGSRDRTCELLHEYFGPEADFPVETMLLRHRRNQGIGAAMSTGFREAKGDVICTLDCDCTYAPEELPRMIDQLADGEGDIMTGSPYHPLGQVKDVQWWRLAISKSASFYYRLLLPAKLYCYTSFCRVYRRGWANPDLFNARGFLGVTEILITAAYCGARIIEYPVQLRRRTEGCSKMRIARVMFDHLRLLSRLCLLNLYLRLRGLGPQELRHCVAAGVTGNADEAGLPGQWGYLGERVWEEPSGDTPYLSHGHFAMEGGPDEQNVIAP